MHAISYKLLSGKNVVPRRRKARRIETDHRTDEPESKLVLAVVNGDLTGWEALKTAKDLSDTPMGAYDGITLSLEKMKSIDSAGIAILVRLYSQLKRRRKTLSLEKVPEEIRGFLTQIGLEEILINTPTATGTRAPSSRKRSPRSLRPQPTR